MKSDKVTGILQNWWADTSFDGGEYFIKGNINGDIEGRFQDGTYIHTSGIRYSVHFPGKLKEGDVVRTRNSVYLLGTPLADQLELSLCST